MSRVATFTIAVSLVFASSHLMGRDSGLSKEEQTNKEVIEWIFAEGLNKQNPEACDSVLSDDYVRYCDAMPPDLHVMRGKEIMLKFLAEHFVTFPDWNEEIIEMVVENDKVAIVSVATGTMIGKMGPY